MNKCLLTLSIVLSAVSWSVAKKEVWGFIPSTTRTEEFPLFDWERLSTVIWFGNPVPTEFIALAHKYGVRVHKLASKITPELLRSSIAQIQWIFREIWAIRHQNLDGLNFDYEGAIAEGSPEQKGFLSLVQYTSRILTFMGKNVSVDVAFTPVNCADERCYPLKQMAPYVERFFVMGYDERAQVTQGPCIAGPNAAIGTTRAGLQAHIKAGLPAEKLILGVPWYGRDYPCTAFVASLNLCFIQPVPYRGVACSDSPGLERDYDDLIAQIHHDNISVHWNSQSQSPFFSYEESDGGSHMVWFDGVRSLSAKLSLVKKLGLSGGGMWHAAAVNNAPPQLRAAMWATFDIMSA